MYVEALDQQAMSMPRCRQALEQVTHALPGRQVPVRLPQALLGNAHRGLDLRQLGQLHRAG
ncbi:hypothetical protein D3C78_1806960 [compost metagenome]